MFQIGMRLFHLDQGGIEKHFEHEKVVCGKKDIYRLQNLLSCIDLKNCSKAVG